MTRHKNSIPLFNFKRKNSFFPPTIIERNKLDSSIRNSKSLAIFKKRISAFVRPSANSTFHCHNPNDLKLITSLRLGLTHFSPMSHFYPLKTSKNHRFSDALTFSVGIEM